jgi:hypothetical protein
VQEWSRQPLSGIVDQCEQRISGQSVPGLICGDLDRLFVAYVEHERRKALGIP